MLQCVHNDYHIKYQSGSSSCFLFSATIQVLYDWDRPNLHSPVKSSSKSQHSVRNVVAVFTKVPSTQKELDTFFGGKRVRSANDIQQSLFGQCKNLQNLRSNSEIGVKLVDTSCLYDEFTRQPEPAAVVVDPTASVPTFHEGQANFYKSFNIGQAVPPPSSNVIKMSPRAVKRAAEQTKVKSAFQKCLSKNYRGGVIQLDDVRKIVRNSLTSYVEPWAVQETKSFK
jgi:hypothetical protein